jgi:hypothetical protein
MLLYYYGGEVMYLGFKLSMFLAIIFYGWIFATFLYGVANASRTDGEGEIFHGFNDEPNIKKQ